MSARERLTHVLLMYFTDGDPGSAGGLEKLQTSGLVDDFAHELAELQRKVMAEADGFPPGGRAAFLSTLPDLIDPMED
ncbi:hypothetical protein [Streptomyces sp. NPDC002346]